jgi:hypothetical protein
VQQHAYELHELGQNTLNRFQVIRVDASGSTLENSCTVFLKHSSFMTLHRGETSNLYNIGWDRVDDERLMALISFGIMILDVVGLYDLT